MRQYNINDETIYLDCRVDIKEDELEQLYNLCKYACDVLEELEKQGKLSRIPNRLYASALKKKFPEATDLIEKIDSLPPCHKSGLHRFFYDCFRGPSFCKYCVKPAIFQTFVSGYKPYCNSVKCYERVAREHIEEKYGKDYFQSEDFKEKIKKATRSKYGVDWYVQTSDFQEKVKKNNLEKYGVEWHTQVESVKAKARQTMLENYGVLYPSQSKEIKKKIQQTNLERYGVANVIHSEEIRNRVRESNLKKYGVPVAAQSEEVKRKIRESNLKKHGVEWYVQSEEFKRKVKEKHREKYGVDWTTQQHIKNTDKLTKEYIEQHFVDDRKRLNFERMCDFYNLSYVTALKYVKEFEIDYRVFQSNAEIELFQTFCDLQPRANVRDVIPPYELDVYFPNQKLAIEYNGLMYHSFGISNSPIFHKPDIDPKIHLRKTELCEEQGVQLLHIFENEWVDKAKRNIWLSVIRSKLGIIDRKIYARKCKVREIDGETARKFLDNNHLQGGTVKGKVNLGLYNGGELIAVMTFAKSRYDKEIEWELLRYASKINIIVAGGFSKLLRHFELCFKPKSLVSYANRRWSNGKVYEVNDFEYISDTQPNYYYFKPNENTLLSRQRFQKHKLKDILERFDSNKSELENMFENGYRVIYDCGNKKYFKKY